MGLPLPVENGSDVPFGRRRSTKGSPAGMPSVMTPMPSFTQNCGQMQLSTAPQTKSEQQKQALAKLAKTDMDIEEIVQRVLSAQQHQDGSSNPLVLSETEKLHASQAIVNLLKQKQKPKAVRPQQRNLTQGSASASGTKYCEFENCNFSGRLCDLNKHRKRHQKPYGSQLKKEMDRTKFEDDEPMDADVEAMDNGESFTYETTSASAAHFDVQGTKHRDFSPREAGSSPRSHKRSKQSRVYVDRDEYAEHAIFG
ncbi:hypothetical protein N0V86_002106 [Didymella sp. IMI 355093]|nr:hypothetical protein N0V86_002106 [Didymella sp. IMI 355093]